MQYSVAASTRTNHNVASLRRKSRREEHAKNGSATRETGRKDKTIAQGKAQLAYTEMAMDRLVLI